MHSCVRPIFEQIVQYALLLGGNAWPADPSIFFAAGLTGKDAIATAEPSIWYWISIVCFIVFFFITVRFSAVSRDE